MAVFFGIRLDANVALSKQGMFLKGTKESHVFRLGSMSSSMRIDSECTLNFFNDLANLD